MVGYRVRRDLQDAALQRARRLVADGEPICDCSPRPAAWQRDGVGMLRCPQCHGIEPGQADQAAGAT
jgi:hypothetical protein